MKIRLKLYLYFVLFVNKKLFRMIDNENQSKYYLLHQGCCQVINSINKYLNDERLRKRGIKCN